VCVCITVGLRECEECIDIVLCITELELCGIGAI